jgi:PST family polysaccharide transporter
MAALRHGGLAVAGTLATIALTLVRTKLLAVYLTPTALGLVGLFTNLSEMAAVLFGAGLAGVLNRLLPRAKSKEQRDRLASSTLILAVAMIALFSPMLIAGFYHSTDSTPFSPLAAIILTLMMFCAALGRILNGMLMGDRKSGRLAIVLFAGPGAALLGAILLVSAGVREPIYYAALATVFLTLGTLVVGGWHEVRAIHWRALPTRREAAALLGMAIPLSLALLFWNGLWFYLRVAIEARMGGNALGYIQPAFQLAGLIGTVFTAFCGMTIVRWNQSAHAPFARRQLFILALSTVLVIGSASGWFLEPVLKAAIVILFSSKYLPIVDALPWFLQAEGFRMAAFVLDQTLISKGYASLTIWPKAACAAAVVALTEGGLDYSLIAFGMAYAAGHALLFVLSAAQWARAQGKVPRDRIFDSQLVVAAD